MVSRRPLAVSESPVGSKKSAVLRRSSRAALAAVSSAVPLSPDELSFKIQGIYLHQTQRSQSPSISRQSENSWNLASELNRATAKTYDALGLPEYEAIEGFKRYLPQS